MGLNKPIVRVRYDLVELDPPLLRHKLQHIRDLREPAAVSAPSGANEGA